MSKLPLVLTIVALFCATSLGFIAKQRADQKVRELASTRTELKTTQGTLATTKDELGKANEHVATAEKEIEAKGAEVTKLAGEVKATKDQLEEATDTVKKRDNKVADLELEIKEAGVKMDAAEKAKNELETQLADAKKELDEKNVALAALEARVKRTNEIADAPAKPSGRSGPSPSLTGSVLAVNEGLNFLVLSVGDQQGVSVNTSMLVVRGAQRVATLKVKSIEPRTSIAEVVPGSIAHGKAVQRGDRVVLVRDDRTTPTIAPSKGSRSPRRTAEEPALPEA